MQVPLVAEDVETPKSAMGVYVWVGGVPEEPAAVTRV